MKINILLLCQNNSDTPPDLGEQYQWKRYTSTDNLMQVLRQDNPMAIVAIRSKDVTAWEKLSSLPYYYRYRWLMYDDLFKIVVPEVQFCANNVMVNYEPYNKENPCFSVITTTYKSGDKIFRPWNSLKSQTYTNWEWIVWDDSGPDDNDVWTKLLQFRNDDIRVHCYRDALCQNSGFIGEMKWRAASLCKGNWIVELDHDDIIDDNLFIWCQRAINQFPDADFIFSDSVELSEINEEPVSYGEFFSFGYGSISYQFVRGKWHAVTNTRYIEPKTIRHIVGVPNHVRIWRRDFYDKIGRHNWHLPVSDDYELLVRTFLNSETIVKISKPLYFQFRNEGGNNFTFLRNKLIQHLTNKIQQKYEIQLSQRLEEHYGIEDYVKKSGWNEHVRAWMNPDFKYLTSNIIKTFDDKSSALSIIVTLTKTWFMGTNLLQKLIATLKKICIQSHDDIIIYIIAIDNMVDMTNMMALIAKNSFLSKYCNEHKIRWMSLSSQTTSDITDDAMAKNYALRMLIDTDLITYYTDYEQDPDPWDSSKYLKSLLELYQTIPPPISTSNNLIGANDSTSTDATDSTQTSTSTDATDSTQNPTSTNTTDSTQNPTSTNTTDSTQTSCDASVQVEPIQLINSIEIITSKGRMVYDKYGTIIHNKQFVIDNGDWSWTSKNPTEEFLEKGKLK